ncbi:hypothetical protein [Lactiplantibacillus herbarum]|uniref:hypothetical protein n=1 Tax=Lactiplantibacillus herbarum TaxID=1670446 RepID=UPI00064ED3AD|nr:hypothetical protein [Lactiplantibacillus herbarum]
MKWKSIWRHTRTILLTLVIYFMLIQGPYDLWISKDGYRIGSYLIDIVGVTGLFIIVEMVYNYFRQWLLKRHSSR